MITIDDVRALTITLPRSTEAFVRGCVKFRVGRIVYIAFSRDEELMGFAFPKEEGEAIIANAGFTFTEMKRHLDISKARVWAGLRPVSPAGTPIMGPTTTKGLFVNAGHGHLGWTLACGSGRVLADVMNGRDPGIPLPQPQGGVAARAA